MQFRGLNCVLLFSFFLFSICPYAWGEETQVVKSGYSQFNQSDCGVIRAAIDIGSSSTKLFIASVNRCYTPPIIIDEVAAEKISVPYYESILKSPNREISTEVLEEGIRAIQAFLAQAISLGATEIAAVATQSFRLASNQSEVLSKIKRSTGLNVQVISQELEGILGYLAVRTSREYRDTENLIVWEIGSMSTQITASKFLINNQNISPQNYLTVTSPYGSESFKDFFLKEIRKAPQGTDSPNPIFEEEFEEAKSKVIENLSEHTSAHFLQVFKRTPTPTIVAIGGVLSKGMPVFLRSEIEDKDPYDLRYFVSLKKDYVFEQKPQKKGQVPKYWDLPLFLKKADSSKEDLEKINAAIQQDNGKYSSTAVTNFILTYSTLYFLPLLPESPEEFFKNGFNWSEDISMQIHPLPEVGLSHGVIIADELFNQSKTDALNALTNAPQFILKNHPPQDKAPQKELNRPSPITLPTFPQSFGLKSVMRGRIEYRKLFDRSGMETWWPHFIPSEGENAEIYRIYSEKSQVHSTLKDCTGGEPCEAQGSILLLEDKVTAPIFVIDNLVLYRETNY